MQAVISAVEVVLSIFLMISVGMLLTKFGWIQEKESRFLSRFVLKIALPATIVSNIFEKFTAESLLGMAAGLIIPALSLLIAASVSFLLSRLLKIPENRRGAYVVMFTFSNSVFIGLPVCRALFGEDAVSYTLIYYIANTTLFWTLGFSLMRRDGGKPKEETSLRLIPEYIFSKDKSNSKYIPAKNALSRLNKAVPLPLIFLIVSSACVLLGVSLPDFVMSSAGYIGSSVTPLSLVYTGCVLMRMIRTKHMRFEKGYISICIGRFILVPMLVIGLSLIYKSADPSSVLLTPVMLHTFIIEASMPIMTQTTIVEAGCGGDDEYVAGATALTTALSLLFIPAYMYVITSLL
ncbi:MAG: AEC family transporter [Clostridia bacterium]|nr:AEC family transporter [Clostridia bacterium]MBQ4158249.1 AEC family transporter [Clostridia bacterium]